MKVFLLVGAGVLVSLVVTKLIKSRRGGKVWHDLETG
ncbi:hypothetical protein BDB13_0931 [Rhodococcus sp. OK302]|nr:hypothetical protein BDB13_0931 [Rhodococcus sp. OK302]